jgi:hypothetical protein
MNSSRLLEERSTQPENHNVGEPERFVDAVVAAKFLSMQRRQLLELARAGTIPAYPIGDGQRRLCDFGCRSCEGDGTTNDSRKEHEECRCERTSVNSLEPMSAFRFRRVWVSSGREKIPVALRRICCCERRSCYYFGH